MRERLFVLRDSCSWPVKCTRPKPPARLVAEGPPYVATSCTQAGVRSKAILESSLTSPGQLLKGSSFHQTYWDPSGSG